jgi:hypothetical protein
MFRDEGFQDLFEYLWWELEELHLACGHAAGRGWYFRRGVEGKERKSTYHLRFLYYGCPSFTHKKTLEIF